MKKYKVSHKSLDKEGYKNEKRRKVSTNDRRIYKVNLPIVEVKEKVNENIVYGSHAVLSTLKTNSKLVEKVYVRDGLANRDMPTVYDICKDNRIPITTMPNDFKMTELAGTSSHQGLVAIIRDFEYTDIDEMLALNLIGGSSPRLFIILDEIEDPHNVGAIIRTAVAVGATGIIVPKHRQAPISGAVYKASTGLVSQIPIARVSNISVVIEKLKKSHIWVGALGMQSSPLTPPHNEKGITQNTFWNLDLSGDLAIIVGNEGKGVQTQHIKDSDMIISIPMDVKVESLNASVAAAIAMYEWRRQNGV